MIDTSTLIDRADAYKQLCSIAEDSTVSYRVFGDTKKLTALRNGSDITVRRFNTAMRWFDQNWPEGPASADNPTSNTETSHDNS